MDIMSMMYGEYSKKLKLGVSVPDIEKNIQAIFNKESSPTGVFKGETKVKETVFIDPVFEEIAEDEWIWVAGKRYPKTKPAPVKKTDPVTLHPEVLKVKTPVKKIPDANVPDVDKIIRDIININTSPEGIMKGEEKVKERDITKVRITPRDVWEEPMWEEPVEEIVEDEWIWVAGKRYPKTKPVPMTEIKHTVKNIPIPKPKQEFAPVAKKPDPVTLHPDVLKKDRTMAKPSAFEIASEKYAAEFGSTFVSAATEVKKPKTVVESIVEIATKLVKEPELKKPDPVTLHPEVVEIITEVAPVLKIEQEHEVMDEYALHPGASVSEVNRIITEGGTKAERVRAERVLDVVYTGQVEPATKKLSDQAFLLIAAAVILIVLVK